MNQGYILPVYKNIYNKFGKDSAKLFPCHNKFESCCFDDPTKFDEFFSSYLHHNSYDHLLGKSCQPTWSCTTELVGFIQSIAVGAVQNTIGEFH